MPAWRLDNQNRTVHPYDVGAIDGTIPGFAPIWSFVWLSNLR